MKLHFSSQIFTRYILVITSIKESTSINFLLNDNADSRKNHLSKGKFIWGKTAPENIFSKLSKFLKDFSSWECWYIKVVLSFAHKFLISLKYLRKGQFQPRFTIAAYTEKNYAGYTSEGNFFTQTARPFQLQIRLDRGHE